MESKDYSWITNGWELITGDGLRKEIQTVAWSETNTLKTVTYQVKDGGGTLVYQRIEKYRTNSVYGVRRQGDTPAVGSRKRILPGA